MELPDHEGRNGVVDTVEEKVAGESVRMLDVSVFHGARAVLPRVEGDASAAVEGAPLDNVAPLGGRSAVVEAAQVDALL